MSWHASSYGVNAKVDVDMAIAQHLHNFRQRMLGVGDSLSGRLLLFDGLAMSLRQMRAKRRPDCTWSRSWC